MTLRDRTKERAFEKSVVKTLAYRAVFNYPMSFHQISTYLLSKNKVFEYKFIKKELSRLIKSKRIIKVRDTYSLNGIKPVSWHSRYKKTKEIISECQETIETLKSIPWIKLMCITGSVAAFNTDKDADLDLFIVTTARRLWITRAFIVLLLKIQGRYPRQNNSNTKICPNILIDESKLAWPRKKQSVYIANEILTMQPILNREETYYKFLNANNWINKFFLNYQVPSHNLKSLKKKSSKVLDVLESILMFIQLKYMQKHKTKEVTRRNFIHFNKNDNYDWIMDKYEDLLKKHIKNS